VAVGSSLTATFKVKVTGEPKLDAAGLRFGFASNTAEANKNEGYYFCLGVETEGFSLYRKNPAPLGQLGGREPQFILLKNYKLNFNIGDDNATEVKLTLERLTYTTPMLKLYSEGELRFKHELTAESADKPIDQLMLGIGNAANVFQIDNFELEFDRLFADGSIFTTLQPPWRIVPRLPSSHQGGCVSVGNLRTPPMAQLFHYHS